MRVLLNGDLAIATRGHCANMNEFLTSEQERLDGKVSQREMPVPDFKMLLFALCGAACLASSESHVHALRPNGQ
jgi:hypothetical protein